MSTLSQNSEDRRPLLRYLRGVVAGVVVLFALLSANVPGLETDQASASTLRGYSNSTSLPIYAYRWNGSTDVSVGRVATTNSNRYYQATLPGNAWYYVQGYRKIGTYCRSVGGGGIYLLSGYSDWVWLPANSSANANVSVQTVWSC